MLPGSHAQAGDIEDIPGRLVLNVSAQNFENMDYYPALFETYESRSENIKPFTKWAGMFDRFDRHLRNHRSVALLEEWQGRVRRYEGRSLKDMVRGVNSLVNEKDYILDQDNWGISDYWASPIEFLERGGDCEDFAIAKYAALRSLGVPEERLRLAIVHDTKKDIPHAVLVVYDDHATYILDNQTEQLISGDVAGRYRPIYSINRFSWWLHKQPDETVLASVQ